MWSSKTGLDAMKRKPANFDIHIYAGIALGVS
jgi:hypothetical protein